MSLCRRTVTIPTAGVSDAMAAYTIEFAKLEVHNRVEDAIGAGSGTLVSVGKVHGILMAAHVLTNLPDLGDVGIVEYRGRRSHYRKRTIEMANTTKIVLRDDLRPGRARSRLPAACPNTVGWFEAIGSFYNLLKHRSDASEPPPSPNSADAIVGMIDERTKDLPAEDPTSAGGDSRRCSRTAPSRPSANVGGYDLFDFAPTDYPDFKLPGNYKGTSGGAVWRIYLKLNGEKPEIAGSRLWGVPYYQTKNEGGGYVLTCHGMGGVYGALLDAVIAKWPDETK